MRATSSFVRFTDSEPTLKTPSRMVHGEQERAGHVPHVDERAPEVFLVDDELAVDDGLVYEVVDHQVQPQPRREAEGGGEPVDYGVPGVQQALLGLGLRH